MQAFPSASGLQAAMRLVSQYIPRTPLVHNEKLSSLFGLNVHLKIETVTAIGSFKLRGAINRVLKSRTEAPLIVTSSTGNHGLGVAYAARLLNRQAVVFLPENPHQGKKRKIEALGATVVMAGRDIDAAKEAAKDFAVRNSGLFVDDGEDMQVMEGAGTVGLEIAEDMPQLDFLIAPMGGGNLAAGCAVAVKSVHPKAKVFAVQSAGAPSMHVSLLARKPVERDVQTVAECLAQRVPADLAFRVALRFLDRSFLVSDDDLLAAAKTLAIEASILSEPGAASPLACLARYSTDFPKGSHVALVISGANIDPETLQKIALAPALINRPLS